MISTINTISNEINRVNRIETHYLNQYKKILLRIYFIRT